MKRLNNKTFHLILMMSIFGAFLFANAPDTAWTKTYGTTQDDWAYAVEQTSDGGYIIAGYTESAPVHFDGGDFYLVKTNENGNTIWVESYQGPGTEKAYSLCLTHDNGYVIAGGTSPIDGTINCDVYFLKANSSGTELWNKQYGDTVWEEARSIQKTLDQGFIVAGVKDNRVFLAKTDSLGDTLWTKKYNGLLDSWGFSVEQTSDGGYIIAGAVADAEGVNPESLDVYLIKTDTYGNIIWDIVYGGDGDDRARSVQQTSDGGYIVAGYSNSFSVGKRYDVYVFKTDSLGDVIWKKTYGDHAMSDDWAYAVDQTSDGGFVIAGCTYSPGTRRDGKDIYILKMDSLGIKLWGKTIGGRKNDWAYAIDQTSDGGYIIAGYTNSFGVGANDIYLIKIKSTKLVLPDGGEEWIGGSTETITWWCEHPMLHSYRLLLFCGNDMGIHIDTIADGISSDSTSWDWTLPLINLENCRIKLEVLDDSQNVISTDESNGDFSIILTNVEDEDCTEGFLFISQSGTNPFKERTKISYGLNKIGEVRIVIYNSLGQEVKVLLNEKKNPGTHTTIWDGRDDSGMTVPSGVYLMRFVTEDFKATKKLLLIR